MSSCGQIVLLSIIDWVEIFSSQDKEDASQGMAERSGSSEATDGLSTQHAFFSKYDAVEKYLKGKGYPPGLSSVEKNTFRRLCSRFAIHGEDSIVDKFLIKKDVYLMFKQLTDIWTERKVIFLSRYFQKCNAYKTKT